MKHYLPVSFLGVLALGVAIFYTVWLSKNRVFLKNLESNSTAVLASTIIPKEAVPSFSPTASPPPQIELEKITSFRLAENKDSNNLLIAQSAGAQFFPTIDTKSYYLFWKPKNWENSQHKKIIISLHGRGTYATADFAKWQPYLENSDIALVSLEWWATQKDFYTPEQIYPQIVNFMASQNVTHKDIVMLHGFSRGGVVVYGLAYLDRDNKYFDYLFADAGGILPDVEINKSLLKLKDEKPYLGSNWILYCGQKDPDINLYGCPQMNKTKDLLTNWGANIILFIQDENGGHTGFRENTSNVAQVLSILENGN